MQAPEKMTLLPPEGDGHYTYLMIFEDGCRIDLSFEDKPYVDDGEPAIPLLDKDGILPALPPPSDRCWHIQDVYKRQTYCRAYHTGVGAYPPAECNRSP